MPRKKDDFFGIIIPERHRQKIKFLRYSLVIVGLSSAFIVFNSVWLAFLFGFVIYLISFILEKIAFAHLYAFIHPFPDFEVDPDKWVGMGFGYMTPTKNDGDIPLVSMMIKDLDYAKKIESLFLRWTDGQHIDEDKYVQISVVQINEKEYIFLCYPNPRNSVSKRFFQSARDKLRYKSLRDEVMETHITLVFGKRCKISENSYFPEFRKRYHHGVPVAFDFILPPFEDLKPTTEISTFVFFDFSIKDKSELTRKDFAYDAIWSFEKGGNWQGPSFEK